MKARSRSKLTVCMLLLYFGLGIGPLLAFAGVNESSEPALDAKPIAEILESLSEKHHVFFSYDATLLKEIAVDFEFIPEETLDNTIDRLMAVTNLQYDVFDNKYFVIYEKSKQAEKDARKVLRKFKQIDRLERKGGLALESLNPSPDKHLSSVLKAAVELKQEVTITGSVKDNEGEPLLGATIQVKGVSGIGTIADADGNFTLNVPDAEGILIVSYVGYETLEVPIDGRTMIEIILVESTSQLEEVVVVGYGTLRQKELTSAVTSVNADDFNRGSIHSTEQLLQGKVAGLTIAKAGSDPNQPFFVNLRGVSTLGANSTPLVVIDGVIGGNLELVDPNDIETVDVLKDASAAAIYGTRGSAGVIIVTTKTGRTTDKGVVDYNGYVSFSQPLTTQRIRQANAEEFIGFGGVDWGGDTDFVDEITRVGVSQVHNVSFANNTKSTDYRASINYRDVQGTLMDQGYKQLNGRINVGQKLLKDRLVLTSTVSFTKRDINYSNPGAIRYAGTFAPSSPVYINDDPDQGYFENYVEQNYNPVAMIKLNPHLGVRKNILGNFKADFEVIDGLMLSANYAIQSENELQGVYSYSNSRAGAVATNGRADRMANEVFNQLFETTARYNGSSGDLSYTVLGGYSYQEFVFESFEVTNTDFITDELTFNNLGLGNGFADPEGVRSTASNKEEALLASLFSRVNLNYKDTYYFMASYRREGSSRFGANNRWGDFWAVGGGVNIGDLVDLAFLNNLKLRVGYGVTGNLPRQNYAYLTTLGAVGLGYIGGDFVPAIQPTSNPNPDLKWEEKGEFNVGLDFAILDFKLSGSLDYFKRNTKDLLNTISVASPPNLFGSSLVNLGELESNGFEMQLNYLAIQTSDLRWDITATFSTNETKLVKFNNDDQVSLLRGEGVAQNGSYAALVEEGKPLGQIISPTFVGYSDIGAPLFLDPDGNPTDDNQLAELRTIQGNGFPDFTWGLATSLSYKGLDFNLFLRSAIGHEIANGRRARYEHPAYVGIQNVVITEETTTEDKGQLIWHSKFVETASFLILDNVTIGYTIPLPKSETFRNLRVYLTGERLFTLTNYLGSDPEVRYIDRGRGISRTPGFNGNPQYGGDILVAGMDRWENGHYPARTFTIGLNVGF